MVQPGVPGAGVGQQQVAEVAREQGEGDPAGKAAGDVAWEEVREGGAEGDEAEGH